MNKYFYIHTADNIFCELTEKLSGIFMS